MVEVLEFSVDTKVLKSKIIPKNNVYLPCRELGKVWEGIRYRYREGMQNPQFNFRWVVFKILGKQKGNRHCPFPRCGGYGGRIQPWNQIRSPRKGGEKVLYQFYKQKIKILLTLY